ncbi:hypothetical protein L7F22_044263 [Adiantum nelumboides]|nr:hypothetical protein [Adiantum nelumboides]
MEEIGNVSQGSNTVAPQILTPRIALEPIGVTTSFAPDYRNRHSSRSERPISTYDLHQEYPCNPRNRNSTDQVITQRHDQQDYSLNVHLFDIDKSADYYQRRSSLSNFRCNESRGNPYSSSYRKYHRETTANTALPSVYQQFPLSQAGAPFTSLSQKDLRITELSSHTRLNLGTSSRLMQTQDVKMYASSHSPFPTHSLPEVPSISLLGPIDGKRTRPFPLPPLSQHDFLNLPGTFRRHVSIPIKVHADQKPSGSTQGKFDCANYAFDGRPVSKYSKRSRALVPRYCILCSANSSPEWRRGPNGPRTLCNACGLFYAKTLRKKKRAQGNDAASVSFEELRSKLRQDNGYFSD